MVFIAEIIYLKKDKTFVTNLDEYEPIGTQWIALYINNNNVTYFDNFGVEHIPKEILKNIHRIKAYNSIMYGYWIYWFYAKK